MSSSKKAKKPGGGQSKSEWVLCPSSGLLHHCLDSASHAAWLEQEQAGSPSYAHIAGDCFSAPLAVVARSSLGLGLPENVLYSSVFVSPAVASACKFGQGAWAVLRAGESQRVVRLFVCPGLVGRSSMGCVSLSWPSLLPSQPLLSLAPLSSPVHLATSVRVHLPPDQDSSCPRLRSAARHHLTELVLRRTDTVPLPYYGATIFLSVTVTDEEGNTGDLAEELLGLKITPDKIPLLDTSAVTSTPVKHTLKGGDVSEQTSLPSFYRVSLATKVVFEEKEETNEDARPVFLGGIASEIATIKESLSAVLHAKPGEKRLFTGLLLFGPPGTGKTSLAHLLPSLLSCSLVTVAGPQLYSKFYGETESQLRAKFEEAEAKSPCVLFIDELDSVAPRREAGASDQERRVGASLVCLLDKLGRAGAGVVVVAATSRLEAVDPGIRRPGRLDLEVELGVPGVGGRLAILRGLLEEVGTEVEEEEVARLARDTHGFVGADLQALVSMARMEVRRGEGQAVTMEHLLRVRPKVKPSAMREVMVEVPEVTWQDIGGLEELKLKLRQAVEWPIKHPEVFTRMGISAPRGLLMYGPPGCSKTMIAKALANESGLNFLSIKGPELFSKWVGESERAVREVFRRARQVKPSIIFFDEIDAIGGARGGSGSGKVGDRVLAQLLTEMDGVEGLRGVTVVAATNRPDMMDQALLRPGRLDRVVYVPLPDLATRRQVLAVHTRKIPVAATVDLEQVAECTEGYSGAEVAAVCNEAALAALEENVESEVVEDRHFEAALASVTPRITPELFEVYERFQKDNTSKKV